MSRAGGSDVAARYRSRAICLIAAIVCVTIFAVLRIPGTSAHARLVAASPAPGSALAEAPSELRIAFSEPVEIGFSRAELLASDGRAIPIAPISADPHDPKTLVVHVLDPAAVGRGAYVVVWRVLSATDGHATSGTLPFSVGTGQVPLGIGSLETSGRPPWWRVLIRWLELTSMLGVAGGFVFAGFVAPPGGYGRQIWRGAAVALALGLAMTFIDQGLVATGTGLGNPPSPALYRRILFHSTSGTAWLVRVAAFVCLVAIWLAIEKRSGAGRRLWFLGMVLSGGMLLTVPVAGHAAGEPDRILAIATDWLHLWTAAAWLGGLGYLLADLTTLRRSPTEESAAEAARLVTRFSRLALVAVCVLLATGFGNAAFHVSGPRALRDQDYGVTLLAKHVTVALLLIAAGVNLLVNRPRLRSLAAVGTPGAIGRHLRTTELTVAVEMVFGLAIVLAAAGLTELPPADAPLAVDVAAKEVVVDQRATAGDLGVGLLGRLSGNPDDRFTIAVTSTDGRVLAAIQRVIVEASVTTKDGATATTDRFDAQPLPESPGSYAFPAVRLGLQTVWDLTVIVRQAGVEDVRASFSIDTRQAGVPPSRAANDVWNLPRFTIAAWALFALAAIVAIGGVVGVSRLPALEPMAAALILTMVALIAAGFAVSAARLTIPVTVDTDLVNPTGADAGSIQRGAAIYAANCLACHSASGAGVETTASEHNHGTAADLTDRRSRNQRDGDLYHAVTYGVPGSAMPAYDWALSDGERWDVVNYVRQLQSQRSP